MNWRAAIDTKIIHRPKYLVEDYVRKLSFVNAGALEWGNVYCIDYVMKNMKSAAPFFEIGSLCGLSTNIISYYRKKYNRTNDFYSCDKWDFGGGERMYLSPFEGTGVTEKSYGEFVKQAFISNVKMFSAFHLPYHIEEFSDQVFKWWEEKKQITTMFGQQVKLGGTFSFVFIDGNHDYEFAKIDFENTDRFLEKDGYILFDDSHDFATCGVPRVIKEMKQTGRYKVVMKNPNYLVQKIN